MRRSRRIRRIIFFILILPVIFAGVLIIRSNIFIIRFLDVQEERVGCTNSEQIKNTSRLYGQNFFVINSKNIEDNLKRKFFCIKSAKTSRYFPNKANLYIFGREPAAILMVGKNKEATDSGILEKFSEVESTSSGEASSSAITDTKHFVVDNEGIIYSNNIEQINAPRVYVSGLNLTLGQNIKGDLIGNTLKILEKLKVFGVELKEAKIYSEDLLLTGATAKIIFRLDEKIDTQIASLQLILDKAKIDEVTIEFIDLRFDKPVIRLAPKVK